MTERQELITQKKEAEKQIETLYKEQRSLRDKITKIIHEQLPRLERESGDLLSTGGDFEEMNDEINKLKRSTRTMDNQIFQKGEEMDKLRAKITVIEDELSKLPEPEPEETLENKKGGTL